MRWKARGIILSTSGGKEGERGKEEEGGEKEEAVSVEGNLNIIRCTYINLAQH